MSNYGGIDQQQMREIEKLLAPFDRSEQKKILTKGTKSGATLIARAARQLAPKDTGAGAKDIKPRKNKSKDWVAYAVSTYDQIAKATAGYYMHFQDVGYKRSRTKVKTQDRKGEDRPEPDVEGKFFVDRAEAEVGGRVLAATLSKIRTEVDKAFEKRG